ncbi:MAG: nuclear transport factor 2 family protein [Paracoccaceae bacterium]
MDANRGAVRAAVMDYFAGWFDGDAARMEGALHPDLVKRGMRRDVAGAQLTSASTAPEMIRWTAEGEGMSERPDDLTIEIRVDDLYGSIANATVYSTVYVEYLQLVKTSAGWKIVGALWMRRYETAG